MKLIGLDTSIIEGSMLWILVPGILAAHLISEIFYFPEQILSFPLSLLDFRGGLSSFGGFIGGTIGAFVYFRRKKIPLLKYADATMFGLVPAWIIGRLGCTIIFDHPGRPTAFFLGMVDQAGIVRHNLGMYEMLLAILLTCILFLLRGIHSFDGFHTVVIMILYSPVRFLFDFFV